MPIIDLLEQNSLVFPAASHPVRAPGVHLTDVLNDLEDTLFNTRKSKARWENAAETGFLFEDMLSLALRDRLGVRLASEVTCDGILCSPDGIQFDTWELEEYKCTWKSSKNNPVDNWRWVMQIGSYLYALDMTVCYLHVLYVMGDYRGSGPQYRKYVATYTRAETESIWRSVLQHARTRGLVK